MPKNQGYDANQGYPIDWRNDWPLWLVIAAMFVIGALLYPQLPAEMPSHWNIRGQVDGTMPKPWGVYLLPLVTLSVYLLLLVLPRIDPKRANYREFAGAYRAFRLVLIVFMASLYGVVLASALGYALPVDRLVQAGVGLLFAVFGNFLGKVRHNYFVGIKTPWTLADADVWRTTHRFAGKVWVAAGAVAVVASLLPQPAAAIVGIGAMSLAAATSIAYSYRAWHQRQ